MYEDTYWSLYKVLFEAITSWQGQPPDRALAEEWAQGGSFGIVDPWGTRPGNGLR